MHSAKRRPPIIVGATMVLTENVAFSPLYKPVVTVAKGTEVEVLQRIRGEYSVMVRTLDEASIIAHVDFRSLDIKVTD